MRAVVFDGSLRVIEGYPIPDIPPKWALIRVSITGICATDLELTRGYRGFKGVLGHEFVGTVASCNEPGWEGKRVVGEINTACGRCPFCKRGMDHHCQERRVLGISHLDGCMADFCVLPVANLHRVPDSIVDDRAIFTEPLSAACRIPEQLLLSGSERVVVIGDGRLGILCAWVLATGAADVTLAGRHHEKLNTARWRHLKTAHGIGEILPGADIVIDATGSPEGITDAIALVRPGGTIVLKTTLAEPLSVDLACVVVNEITILGSRCGRFKKGLEVLTAYPDLPLERLIHARFPIDRAQDAFRKAAEPHVLKVLMEMGGK